VVATLNLKGAGDSSDGTETAVTVRVAGARVAVMPYLLRVP